MAQKTEQLFQIWENGCNNGNYSYNQEKAIEMALALATKTRKEILLTYSVTGENGEIIAEKEILRINGNNMITSKIDKTKRNRKEFS